MQITFRLSSAAIALGLLVALVLSAVEGCATPTPTAAPVATNALAAVPTTVATALRPAETRAAETRAAESAPTNTPALTAPATATASGIKNPFGILISLSSSSRQNMVKSLGVTYFRPDQAIFVDQWDGKCAPCDAALQMGLKLILTVRANGGRQDPSSAPKDIAAYQKTVGDILDKHHPEVLVVENEENSTIFYTNTPQEYGVELRAACQVAHSKVGQSHLNSAPAKRPDFAEVS